MTSHQIFSALTVAPDNPAESEPANAPNVGLLPPLQHPAQDHAPPTGPIPTPMSSSQAKAEIIGDVLKSVVLDPLDPLYGRIQRVCILDVDRDWTIEAQHGHALTKPPGTTADHSKASESSTVSNSLMDGSDVASGVVVYPHDADAVLAQLDPSIQVETVYLRPDVRQSIAAIRRRKHKVDVFINLYDRADETGLKITEYMISEGIAFTGAAGRFYDPTRMELKRLCRYNKLSTPAFAIVVDSSSVPGLSAELGGFPLFVKPEHGFDSVGIDSTSLIHTEDELAARVAKIVDEFGSALVERYVDGREFSVLVAGAKGNMHVFPPVEYRFPRNRLPTGASTVATSLEPSQAPGLDLPLPCLEHVLSSRASDASDSGSESSVSALDSPTQSPLPLHALAASQVQPVAAGPAFITFDDKWGPSFENRWFLLDSANEGALVRGLEEVATKLYEAFEGEGYCRFDIRLDAATGALMVLDANPNASLFYKDECTVDTILRMVDWGKPRFMRFLIDHALERQRRFHRSHSYVVKYCEARGFSLHAARDLAPGDLIYTDEESALRVVTRSFAERTWTPKDLASFDAYAWPLSENVFAIWDSDSSKWKPINHSCDPNTWMNGLEVTARRPIKQHDELTLDYATFEPTHPAFECWCGAAACRKMVRPNEYKEEWFRAQYGEHVSPHILMLIGREALERERATTDHSKLLDATPTPLATLVSPTSLR